VVASAQQQPDKVWRVGYLISSSATNFSAAVLDAFKLELNDLGAANDRLTRTIVSVRELIEFATLQGAKTLGLEGKTGSTHRVYILRQIGVRPFHPFC
jgi:hypothetical protein